MFLQEFIVMTFKTNLKDLENLSLRGDRTCDLWVSLAHYSTTMLPDLPERVVIEGSLASQNEQEDEEGNLKQKVDDD